VTTLAEKIYEALRTTDWPWSIGELASRYAAEPSEVSTALDILIEQRRVRRASDIKGVYYEIP
jgi:hypothetical protein